MVYHWYVQRLPVRENETEEQVRRQVDFDLGVSAWPTPLSIRQDERKPRVTEDGLNIPDWFADDETESQNMMAALGLE